ncbi:MAG: hypothetical protein WBP82_00670, partial [Leuconostoc mesenteroides]
MEEYEKNQLVKQRLSLIETAIYCKDDSKVKSLLSLINDGKYVSVDTETYNTTVGYEAFDPLLPGAGLRLVQIEADDQIVAFDIKYLSQNSKSLIADFLSNPNKVFIFQNAKFDVKWLKVHLGVKKFHKIYCTMIGSQICSAGQVQYGHSLQDQVLKEFEHYLDKSQGTSNWGTIELTEQQLKYAVTDTVFLKPLRRVQVEKIKKDKLIETVEINLSSIEAYAYMELCGFKLRKERWLKIAERNRWRAIRMEEKISNFLAPSAGLFRDVPTFKVSSPIQLKKALKTAGYEIPIRFDPKKK